MEKTRLKRYGKYTAAGLLAIGLIGGFEGVRLNAYKDVAGIPTVCFGETRGVKMGDKYTLDECKKMLGDAVIEFEQGVRQCLRNPDAIPDKSYVGFLSTAYNIGTPTFCSGSIARKINAGDLKGACKAILLYNKARVNNRLVVIKGLDNRRKEENKLCLEGLK